MRKGRTTCPHPTLPAAGVEQLVIGELKGYGMRPEVRREVRAALARQGSPLDGRLMALMDDFPAVWAKLEPREQVELVRLAVRRVDFDASDSSIEVAFHGTDTLTAREGSREEAA